MISTDAPDPAAVLKNAYRGRRCFVTGHTGFKGSWLCLWLRSLGANITGYALDPPTCPSLFEVARVAEVLEDVRGDVRDFGRLAEAIRAYQPELVFHLAAQSLVRRSYLQPKETFDTNVEGTVNLLEALRECSSIRAIVVITSDKCYENQNWTYAYRETDSLGGHDPYSASKAAAEMVCMAYERSFFSAKGIGLASCRSGNVIGGGDWASDRIIPDAVRAVEAGKPVPVRNPGSVRPWQHVLEPLYGYLLLATRLLEDIKYSGQWNFGPNPESCRAVRELVEIFLKAYGRGVWEDMCLQQTGSFHEAAFLTLAWDKAFRLLAWKPHWSLENAISRTSAWYRRFGLGAEAAKLCSEEIQEYMECL